jgi:secondary thiamine-phosphate synthase enzyme
VTLGRVRQNRTVRRTEPPQAGTLGQTGSSVHTIELTLDASRERIVDLTTELERFCVGLGDGLVNVFVPHATAGVALMETGSRSESDLLAALERLLPRDGRYQHAHGSPGHGADHLLPALVSPSVTLPVLGGRVALGTWQSVVLVDLNVDNPQRHVRFSFVPASGA